MTNLRKSKKTLLFFLFIAATLGASAQIDTTVGITAPKNVSKNTKKLAHYLCDNLTTDREKVNAIYNWVTHNIAYDTKQIEQLKIKDVSTKTALKKKHAVCGGYAKLVVELCKEVEIPAMIVEGYSRDWMFDDGDAFYIPRHAWNAVYVGLQWELLDATWGAGGVGQQPGGLSKLVHKTSSSINYGGKIKFNFRYDTTYFLQNPLAFRLQHLPSDPVWQLTDSTMPLSVFEAGEDAIYAFNTAHPQLHKSDMSLNEIGRMDEMEKMITQSERAYAYNPRYKVVMAEMHIAKAFDTLVDLHKSGESFDKSSVLDLVKGEIKSSGDYVQDQKKTISSQYATLAKKNKAKHADATRYIAVIRNDNKKLSAQCTSSMRKANNHILKEQRQSREAIAKFNAKKKAVTTKHIGTTDATDPRLMVLQDSIANQLQEIEALKEENKQNLAAIEASKAAQKLMADSMINNIIIADSALIQETIARIHLHDNLDKEVKQWNVLVKDARLSRVDSMQKYYLSGFDSVIKTYEAYEKLQKKQLDLCRKAGKEVEQYKRRNSQNPDMLAIEEQVKSATIDVGDAYLSNVREQSSYYQDHKLYMGNLVKLFKHEDKVADYMAKAEDHRNEAEEQHITKWESHDHKENERQQTIVKTAEKKAERYLSSR